MSWIIKQSVEKITFSVNIHYSFIVNYLLFFKSYERGKSEIRRWIKGCKERFKDSWKKVFFKQQRILLHAREKNFNNLKKVLPIKNLDKIPTPKSAPEPGPDPTVFDTPKLTKAKTKHKIAPFILRKEFVSKIANEEKKCE